MDSNVNRARVVVSVITLLLIIYFYYRDIIGYSSRKRCTRWLPLDCRNFIYVILSLLAVLEIGNFARVGTGISYIVTSLPKYYYVGLMVLIPYLMRMVFLAREPIELSEDFRAFPNSILPRKTRPKFILLILLLVLASISLECYSVYSQAEFQMESLQEVARAVVSHPDKYISVLSKTRFLEIPILVYLYKLYKNFSACDYNLPKNWNY